MTDAWIIDVIATRMEEECPWHDAEKVLQHHHWVDVVEHLWKDKGLQLSLMAAYKIEIINAKTQQLLESESDSLPM